MKLLLIAALLTMYFVPAFRYEVEPGHTYRLWYRNELTEPWKLFNTKVVGTNEAPHTVTIIDSEDYKQGFFWLQRDDEPQETPKTNAPVRVTMSPPPPGGSYD